MPALIFTSRRFARYNAFALATIAILACGLSACARKSPSKSREVGAPQIDFAKLDTEGLQYFRDYIRFDTTNPPSNTAAAIAYLKQILDRGGIETQTFESNPGMVTLVARLPGPANSKPFMLMSHADVVPAVAKDWSHPPFAADLEGGFVWGRGAIDNKAHGIMALMTMLAIKRSGAKLKRGVEMMVNPDEEAGGENGAQWMVENHWDAIAPEFGVNEGGSGTQDWLGSRGTTFRIAVAEKRVMWLRLVAHGTSGHGSMPNPDNPNTILIEGLSRVLENPPAYRIVPVIARALDAMSSRMDFPASFELSHIGWPFMMDAALKGPLSSYTVQALMRDTISPTMLNAGFKVNVIPSTSEAGIDCRLLPDTNPDEFLTRLKHLLGPRIQVEFIQKPDLAPESPPSGEAWDAINEVVVRDFRDEAPLVVPSLMAGGTDSRFLRLKGAPSYGFVPIVISQSEAARIHGVDERLSVDNLNRGIRATYDLTMELCGAKP
ncbi:MAG TPA: M20/M25/M40 family metallo-hydrolase [Candidatus Binataceae bacterium]|nr:M20/M25/M40 family metallo-hydrolase [Candidatus Binataceae bacterium]